ncbi:hypothetical protein [Streptomyces sp. RKAG293]|uniref:hypothetical protein n=1 Tax=Streptomyces sp. RKAG293 TaxID=2893403 RepID=UPI0020347038|nr:hypothetical protein [Streptomyces sp. RKAG293]MCM2416718.1 hypothetical protein [Streptomyces sp. RKAG293]
MESLEPPAGWTIQQIRDVSGDAQATVLSADRPAVYCGIAGRADELLHPEIVLGFHELCIVKVSGDDDWHMGNLYGDGSIVCWSTYTDLRDALRGL